MISHCNIKENKMQEVYFKKHRITRKGDIYKPNGEKFEQYVTGRGYKYRSVFIEGKLYYTHRLVAKLFVENDNPKKKRVVNHKDGDTWNNHADNLEWITSAENTAKAYKKHAEKNKCYVCEKPITGWQRKYSFCKACEGKLLDDADRVIKTILKREEKQ